MTGIIMAAAFAVGLSMGLGFIQWLTGDNYDLPQPDKRVLFREDK